MHTSSNLTTNESAEYLRQSTRTLIRWRNQRIGPPWVRVGGKVLYRHRDLDAWMEDQTVQPVANDGGEGI